MLLLNFHLTFQAQLVINIDKYIYFFIDLLIYILILATFGATLKFVVVDSTLPDDEGYDDEYMLEDFEISVADQIQKTKKSNFAAVWESADTDSKKFESITFDFK